MEPVLLNAIYVEDEPDIASLLQNILSAFGISVKTYERPDNFLAERDEPAISDANLFIFDIRLPGMTGLELAAQLRSEGERRPILMVSAYSPPAPSELQELEASFHPKPFDFPVLVDTVRQLTAA